MATLSQLRVRTQGLIREDPGNTRFTDSVLNGYINEGMEFLAVFIEYPRVLDSVVTQLNIGSYANPSDNLLIRTAYFGDPNTSGDIKPVKFVTEETLKEMYPSWLDNTVASQADRPQYLIQLDRKTLTIFPRPNAVAAGKKLWINYNYVPAPLVNDSDVPDIPVPYHSLVPLYASHLAYIGLQQVNTAEALFKDFMGKVQQLKSAVTKESNENLGFSWSSEGLNVDTFTDFGIIP